MLNRKSEVEVRRKHLPGYKPPVVEGEVLDDPVEPERVEVKLESAPREEMKVIPVVQDDPVESMRQRIQEAGQDYLDQVRKMQMSEGSAETEQQLSKLHRSYVHAMMIACVKPLSQEVNTGTVAQAVTMGAAMWMMSPNFRQEVNGYFDNAREKLNGHVESKIEAKLQESERTGRPLGAKWQKRLDKIRAMERGDREPFTAYSAGLTHVGLVENVYERLREPEANEAEIMKEFESSIKTLYDMAATDGLSVDEVSRSARTIVGYRLDADPEAAACFGELAYGEFEKAPGRKVSDGHGGTREVWMGDFVETATGSVADKGMFSPRLKMDENDHALLMGGDIARAFARCKTPADLHGALLASSLGWEAAQDNVPGHLQDIDTSYPNMVDTVQGYRTAHQSMVHDGLSVAQRHNAYFSALDGALEYLREHNPTLEAEWFQTYGDVWESDLHTVITGSSSIEDTVSQSETFEGVRETVKKSTSRLEEEMADNVSPDISDDMQYEV